MCGTFSSDKQTNINRVLENFQSECGIYRKSRERSDFLWRWSNAPVLPLLASPLSTKLVPDGKSITCDQTIRRQRRDCALLQTALLNSTWYNDFYCWLVPITTAVRDIKVSYRFWVALEGEIYLCGQTNTRSERLVLLGEKFLGQSDQ